MQKRLVLFTFVVILALAILLVGCGQQASESQSLSATLSELTGIVSIQDPGSKEFNRATDTSILKENGQIQTGDDGRVRLDLSTGTILRVSPSTLFKLTANRETEEGLATRLQLQIGRIFIILKGGSVDVDTPSGVASVRGSYMMVEVNPDTLDVLITCMEGHCSAGNDAGGLDFTAGEKTILFHRDPTTGEYTAPELNLMTPEDFQEWLDQNPEAQELFNQGMATLTAMAPTQEPTQEPTTEPTQEPSLEPTSEPTLTPVPPTPRPRPTKEDSVVPPAPCSDFCNPSDPACYQPDQCIIPTNEPYNPYCDPTSSYYNPDICTLYPVLPCTELDPSWPYCIPTQEPPTQDPYIYCEPTDPTVCYYLPPCPPCPPDATACVC